MTKIDPRDTTAPIRRANEPISPDEAGNMIQADEATSGPAIDEATDTETANQANEDEGGTGEQVPNPHASQPVNIQGLSPEAVEMLRRRLVAENAAARRLFTEGSSPSAFGKGASNE